MQVKLILSVVLLGLLFAGCAIQNANLQPHNVGDTAADFTLPDQNGKDITLSEILETHDGAVIAFYPKDKSMN